MRPIIARPQDTLTQPAYFTFGKFDCRNPIPVYYFNTALSAQFIISNLLFMDDVIEPTGATLEELFQRDINEDRVEKHIVQGYLLNSTKTKFFPPITVTLVPWDNNQKRIMPRFDSYPHSFKSSDVSHDGQSQKLPNINADGVEAILFSELEAGGITGTLRWDTLRVKAVAIDGQHRLKAIKNYFGDASPANADRTTSFFPVTFIHFGELQPDRSVVQTARELFIDINKQGVKVSQAREIILDDRDLAAVCTRKLLAEQVRDFSSFDQTSPKLPLEAVDWRTESKSIDNIWNLTNTTTLYRIIQKNLFDGKLAKATAYLPVYYKEKLSTDAKAILDSLIEDGETPPGLTMDAKLANELGELFFQYICGSCGMFLKKLKPYENFLRELKLICTAGDETSNLSHARCIYLSETDRVRSRCESGTGIWSKFPGINLKSQVSNVIQNATQLRPKGDTDLFFKAMFQRALFTKLEPFRDMLSERGGYDSDNWNEFFEFYATQLNKIWDSKIFDQNATVPVRERRSESQKNIWEGLAINEEGIIQAKETNVNRTGDMIKLLVCAKTFGLDEVYETFKSRKKSTNYLWQVATVYNSELKDQDPEFEKGSLLKAVTHPKLQALLERVCE
ncbi:MAG TPA: DNA sulfur modification protein DndB [Pseudobdellovibrionaceae bacterium]|nr:DNA sulfur modification protein DndB [Pseudobdellovibrionaceae bacterium]